jgi:hypothetical protein
VGQSRSAPRGPGPYGLDVELPLGVVAGGDGASSAGCASWGWA